MHRITFKLVEDGDELAGAFEVRRQVFVDEQGISEALVFDGRDGEALQMVAKDGDLVVGTARVAFGPGEAAKIERMAVGKEYRDRGLGKGIVSFLDVELRRRHVDVVVLHAQRASVSFYRSCGYRESGPPFLEAGIEHIRMHRAL